MADSLSIPLLSTCMSFLDIKDKATRAARVCRQWKRSVYTRLAWPVVRFDDCRLPSIGVQRVLLQRFQWRPLEVVVEQKDSSKPAQPYLSASALLAGARVLRIDSGTRWITADDTFSDCAVEEFELRALEYPARLENMFDQRGWFPRLKRLHLVLGDKRAPVESEWAFVVALVTDKKLSLAVTCTSGLHSALQCVGTLVSELTIQDASFRTVTQLEICAAQCPSLQSLSLGNVHDVKTTLDVCVERKLPLTSITCCGDDLTDATGLVFPLTLKTVRLRPSAEQKSPVPSPSQLKLIGALRNKDIDVVLEGMVVLKQTLALVVSTGVNAKYERCIFA